MHPSSNYLVHRGAVNRSYSTDGEESQRAPSDRTMSEYIVANEHASMVKPMVPSRKNRGEKHERRSRSAHGGRGSVLSGASRQSLNHLNKSASHGSLCDNGSDIYVTSAAYKAPSEISRGSHYSLAPSLRAGHKAPSHYSYRSGRSGTSTVKTRTSRKGGVVVETMSAPNPFCPNTKGICCLMLLLNLGLILITLGFVIVIQLFEPLFVWILGIVFLIFGFLTLIGSLVYCVHVFRNAKHPHDIHPEDLYWTRHWQGRVGSPPEIHYKAEDKYQDDGYSDRYSKYSGKMSDRHSQRY
ncbi:uncharacterized protein LOC107265645 [Cephus cinctus]|uniref:Uncharacterized protein LOC107265645 n=1 Tax=Cephus cinctus TaxID=211228 RepID=A0AAJ7BNX8_CEPCN|nr:uncharacterized protein LOC107265645 [Cephus cinctus]